MIDQYRVVGNPIKHSKSPQIHMLFAKNTHQEINYQAELIEIGSFEKHMLSLFDAGLKGANVTVPFKEEAYKWVDSVTLRAERAGAVNTILLKEGRIIGDNTDGVGLIADIASRPEGDLSGRRLLIVGAGGATRGALEMLLKKHPQELVIVNRTIERAKALQSAFQDLGRVNVLSYDQLGVIEQPFDWVINATSTGLTGEIPPIPSTVIGSHTICYDMFYCKGVTPFNRWCQSQGASDCLDGLGMLVEQAAEAFFAWRNVKPDTAPVLSQLRDELNSL